MLEKVAAMAAHTESIRFAKYVKDRERRNDIETDSKDSTWKDLFAKESTTAVANADHRRLNHQLYAQQSELCEEQHMLQKLNEQENEKHKVSQEALLAEQLAKLRDDKLGDEKERLRVRQESEELQKLERQLYQAYVSKERHLQLKEKRLELHRQQMAKQQEKEALDEYKKKYDFETQEKYRQRVIDNTRYIEGLKQQFIEKDLRKESEFKQFIKEKSVIDEIVKQIEDEDKRMVRERAERLERTKIEMEEELAARQRQRDELKMQSEAQNKLACDYSAELERRDAAIEAARQHRLAELRDLQRRLAHQLEEHHRCQEEEVHLRTELDVEQKRCAVERAEQDECERQLCRMQEMRRGIEQQLQEKEAQRREEQLRQKATHETMMEKLATEERLELLTLAARRRRQLDHRRYVERMMEESRRRRDDELAQLCHERRELERMEADRQRLVEQERRRLLEQHAIKLFDFLPKGVFRDRNELEELGSLSEPVEVLREEAKEAEHVNICD